jgi:hypothetical protein
MSKAVDPKTSGCIKPFLNSRRIPPKTERWRVGASDASKRVDPKTLDSYRVILNSHFFISNLTAVAFLPKLGGRGWERVACQKQ